MSKMTIESMTKLQHAAHIYIERPVPKRGKLYVMRIASMDGTESFLNSADGAIHASLEAHTRRARMYAKYKPLSILK